MVIRDAFVTVFPEELETPHFFTFLPPCRSLQDGIRRRPSGLDFLLEYSQFPFKPARPSPCLQARRRVSRILAPSSLFRMAFESGGRTFQDHLEAMSRFRRGLLPIGRRCSGEALSILLDFWAPAQNVDHRRADGAPSFTPHFYLLFAPPLFRPRRLFFLLAAVPELPRAVVRSDRWCFALPTLLRREPFPSHQRPLPSRFLATDTHVMSIGIAAMLSAFRRRGRRVPRRKARGARRFSPFLDWCRRNAVQCFAASATV